MPPQVGSWLSTPCNNRVQYVSTYVRNTCCIHSNDSLHHCVSAVASSSVPYQYISTRALDAQGECSSMDVFGGRQMYFGLT
jgi:hypothetical protein